MWRYTKLNQWWIKMTCLESIPKALKNNGGGKDAKRK